MWFQWLISLTFPRSYFLWDLSVSPHTRTFILTVNIVLVYDYYHKSSKNWDTLNYYRDCPTNVIVGFYSAILRSEDADRITNRVDTDQTAP